METKNGDAQLCAPLGNNLIISVLFTTVNYSEQEQWNSSTEMTRHGKTSKQHYKVEMLVVLDFAMYKQ